MAGDDPPTPSWREPVPAVAWSIDPKRPRRRSSQAWPAMIRTTFPRVSKMGLSGLFFDVLPPFLSPFSYNSLIYLSKLYFFTNYSVFSALFCATFCRLLRSRFFSSPSPCFFLVRLFCRCPDRFPSFRRNSGRFLGVLGLFCGILAE